MKTNDNNQFLLNLSFSIQLHLEKTLYFLFTKYKFGILSQLCLKAGDHTVKIEQYSEDLHKITCQDGNVFLAQLEHRNKVYKIKGFAKHFVTATTGQTIDLRINGQGEDGSHLRPAQTGAIYALMSHWSLSNDVSTIVLPTGTGKTETMLVTTLADNANRTLIIVPSIDLKNQTASKFQNWGILRKLGVITYATPNPKVLVLEKILMDPTFIPAIENAQVVITTPAFLARAHAHIKTNLKTLFSHVFFDEAQHVKATEWDSIKNLFKTTKVVQFTATPYRNDRKPIDGKIVYNYPLSQALVDKCFAQISLISIDERHPMKKDKAIAEAAMARLRADRENGWIRHKMMVRVDKMAHAKTLYEKYQEWFPNERITMINSETTGKRNLVDRIKNGEFDIIICVDMLKEGFDFPEFKIAAVHRLHQSLGVLLQFIGRFTRVEKGLGDASFIVNYADDTLSLEMENLLQEGDGWEHVISEIADAKKLEAETLLTFLQGCKPYSGFDSPNIELNPKTVYPALSCVCFRTEKPEWKNFKLAFDLRKFAITQPYYNEKENVFYFTTQKRERVKWAKTNKISDQTWTLIVMHWDKETKLLYIHHSDKSVDAQTLAGHLSSKEPFQLNGDCVFRSFNAIKRLSIVHAGIFKPANHLHRYSRLSGADVTTELSKWKQGQSIKKSDFVGIGFRDGTPESVGASVKGKIWSPARIGDITQWKMWCLKMGALITDESIDANQLLKDSAKKTQLTKYPSNLIVLATDWNEELYSKMHKLSLDGPGTKQLMLSECTLKSVSVGGISAAFVMSIFETEIAFFITIGGENGHNVEGLDDCKINIVGLKSDPQPLKKFFEENPPTIFLINGSTIAGCIQTEFNPGEKPNLVIPSEQIESLLWEKVNFTTESMYKNGVVRDNSVQEYIMTRMIDQGATIVFNDDNAGESADVIAIFEENDRIRFELVHCKYSKAKSGARKNDLFEVCGQAIVSLRYKWKPEELLKHMERRNGTGVLKGNRYYHGTGRDAEQIRKALKYTDVKFEFAIAQPGISTDSMNNDINSFLGSVYATIVEMTETKLKCYFS